MLFGGTNHRHRLMNDHQSQQPPRTTQLSKKERVEGEKLKKTPLRHLF